MKAFNRAYKLLEITKNIAQTSDGIRYVRKSNGNLVRFPQKPKMNKKERIKQRRANETTKK